jgi:hypothetical protein
MMKSCLCVSVVLVGLLAGCNSSRYEVAPVHGLVKLNDKPFPQGSIVFSPVAKGEDANPGKPGTAKIQEDGTYRLSTFSKDDGAVLGEHWVTIIAHDEDNLPDGVPEFARIQVPEKKTVTAGKDNQIDISLSREEIRKYREDDR